MNNQKAKSWLGSNRVNRRSSDDPSFVMSVNTSANQTNDSSFVNNYVEEDSAQQISYRKARVCKFRKKTAAVFITISMLLSLLSLLDCRFIRIDIGFVPENSFSLKSSIGIGLWTVEDPDETLLCLLPSAARRVGSLTDDGDDLYSSMFFNGDAFMTGARLTGLFGIIFGFFDFISTMSILMAPSSCLSKVQYTLYLSFLALLCESIKFGLFFSSKPCTDEMWLQRQEEEELFLKAKACLLDRATYFSLFAIILYFALLVLAAVNIFFPDYSHVGANETNLGDDFDNVSMPSFLQSIGESYFSKKSKESNNVKDNAMAPIIE